MTINEKAARILVKCGYAVGLLDQTNRKEPYYGEVLIEKPLGDKGGMEAFSVPVVPFSDTLEGRRQVNAIEDWLVYEHFMLWSKSQKETEDCTNEHKEHQWRLDRIKWCLQEIPSNGI